jgi:uncharacterized membrane protein YhhN
LKQQHWIFLFTIALAGDIVGIQLSNEVLQLICKPVIVPALIGYLYSQVRTINTGLPKWILFALLFSWAGDVLLMFVSKNENFFLAGLASFLLAHVFYIIFFHQVRVKEAVKPNIVWLILVIVYYTGLIVWLSPYLHDMKLPVRIYGLVISSMLMLALHMPAIKNRKAGYWMMAGAVLFVISDSVLAINKFYQPFDGAGVIIMLTYGLAQLFIVKGAANYINSTHKG